MHKKARLLWNTLLLGFAVVAQADAAVAPKDNAPGVGQNRCQCGCMGPTKNDGLQVDTVNAPSNDTRNCSQLDNRRCAFIRADGSVVNGTTVACTGAVGVSPSKILPIPRPPRK